MPPKLKPGTQHVGCLDLYHETRVILKPLAEDIAGFTVQVKTALVQSAYFNNNILRVCTFSSTWRRNR